MAERERRLPGIRFETRSPALPDVLPRMDIAAFVGFAASGPLHTPVAIEEMDAFTALYGETPLLAWDAERSEAVHAQLAPAVRSFFRAGGRRCWIVRVAGPSARANAFAIPGLIGVEDDGSPRRAAPRARSEGSWSDKIEVSPLLDLQSLAVESADLAAGTLTVRAPQGGLAPGDLLRLRSRAADVYLVVERVAPDAAAAPHLDGASMPQIPAAIPRRLRVLARSIHCFEPFDLDLPAMPQAAQRVDDGESPLPLLGLPLVPAEGGTRGELELTVQGDLADAPRPGSFLRVLLADDELWALVLDSEALPLAVSPPVAVLRIRVRAWRRLAAAPVWDATFVAHRLTLELSVRRPDASPQRLSGLGFAVDHARWWNALPSDRDLFAAPEQVDRHPWAALWHECATPRWPLAGARSSGHLALPLGLEDAIGVWAGADVQTLDASVRDGLGDFGAALFLDPDLVEAGSLALLESADFLRYQSPQPRDLLGIHAVLGVEEVTLLAVPDAAHLGWDLHPVELPEPPPPFPPPYRPEWLGGDLCAGLPAADAGEPLPSTQPSGPPSAPLWERFLRCDLDVVAAPQPTPLAQVTLDGSYRLDWSETPPDLNAGAPATIYELEEAALANFADAVLVQVGAETHFERFGRGPGDLYYRVRARRGEAFSNWSAPAAVRIAAGPAWRARSADDYQPETLIAVQRALLRLCAARGDLSAVLALPAFYREREAIEHVARLRAADAPALPIVYTGGALPRTVTSLPLSTGEARAFSFASLYHPWLVLRDPAHDGEAPVYLRLSPEGAACGILARRALARGAWVAPANELLPDVVALSPEPDRIRLLDLQEAQVNTLLQEPRGFLALSADTLSVDESLRPLNVRRLLILLRRLALRLGARYVFEPNSDAFRRLVQRGFEAMLDDLYARGAFAGATPESAFQVITDSSLNTPQSVDAGRFFVELRVAPSLPMRFITVRLVQTHDRTLTVE